MASQPSRKPPQATAPALGPLPEWDLRDLYPGRDSAELKRDLDASEAAAAAFRQRYEGKLAALPGAALGEAIAGLRAAAGDARAHHELRLAGLCRRHGRCRDRALLPEHAGEGQRHLDAAAVLHPRAQPHRRPRSRRQARKPGAAALRALAARHPRLPPAPAPRRDREAAAREIRRRPRRLDAALRRDHGRLALSRRRPGAHQRRSAAPALRERSRPAPARRQGAGRGVRQERAALRPHHQHAGQGQGDRGSLAALSAADLLAQPRQFRRGRGGRRADRARCAALSRRCRTATTG